MRLTLAYDGGAYVGWQVQKTGTGVQEKVEAALTALFQRPLRVQSSSRTDTGVHALGMVAHVDLPEARLPRSARKLRLAINAFLPEDIRVVEVRRCAADFHARFDAAEKEYRYFLWNHPVMNPLLRLQAWHVPGRLSVTAMRMAARRLVGRHDFRSFAAQRHYEVESTIRTVTRCQVGREGPLVTIRVRAEGFLYKMCRSIAGTLVQVGQGKIPPQEVARILGQRDRRAAGMTAPAHGLVLWKVRYPRGQARAPRARRPSVQPTPD